MSDDEKTRRALEDLVRIETEMRRLLDLVDGRELDPLPGTGWTAAEHVLHVVLATELAAEAFARVIEEGVPGPPPTRFAASMARTMVLATWRIPRGVDALDGTVPDVSMPRKAALARLRQARDAMAAHGRLAPTTRSEAWVLHRVLGPLTYSEWCRFLLIHARHHRIVVRDVVRRAERS